ncbi:MAG TPA: asparagine synthase (glutamine-hydrolyzing) [Polyangiaceae bacterium]|nr:asparagine synthase (glutamine-hydrolyzing) [Polyangiaceae bacterium]
MCGIAVILRVGDRPLPEPGVMGRMLAAIAHRGPDGSGAVTLDDRVMLGAVRLAVIDPHGGKQPVQGCPSARVTCVYNGELYDAANHRRALSRAHAIADACDTTLLPHLYEEHGEAMVEEMRGMFAFAIWDGARRRLLLARDRLGIKPLYYSLTPDFLVAASEMKAIFASGLVAPEIDRDALDDLFSLSYPCPPRTMFRGIVELRPGHRLTVEEGRGPAVPVRWWRAPFRPRGEHVRGSVADVEHALREQLRDAVHTHLVADVPVAARVSGGIDSSAIAALAARDTGGALTTFSIVFDDPQYDERVHARAVARHLGAASREVLADVSAAERLPEMVRALEMPQPIPVAIGGLLLAERERAEGVPVVLTGEGADEIFGGYDVFRAARARRALAKPWARPFRRFAYRAVERATRQPTGLADFLVAGAPRDAAVTSAFHGLRPPWLDVWRLLDVEREALLGVGGRRVRPIEEPPGGFGSLVRDDVAALDPLDAELALELETRLPSWILVIGDRTAMAHGVEMRVPFLDHRVVELAASIPPGMKMRGMREKAILRGAVKGLLPRRIVARRKQPFMTPVRPWFFSARAPAFVNDDLSYRALSEAGLFAPEAVARLRSALDRSAPGSLEGIRLELVMMLVLGTQVLHRLFVAGQAR